MLLAALLANVTQATAQNGSAANAVTEASARRDRRDFAGAVALLREHVAAHPQDTHALRMLAQTLYWMGETDAAGTAYEAAVSRFPADGALHLDYARMLAETGRRERARGLLHPLRETPLAADAEALLGALAYWDGDLSAASRHFARALRHNAEHAEARRQLGEIRQQTAPWVSLGASFRSDDQPLERSAATFDAGAYLTPLHKLTLRAEPQQYSAVGTQGVVEASARWQGYWPKIHAETDFGAGSVRHGVQPQSDWTGHVAAGLHLPSGFSLRARAERSAYHWTITSLSAPVMTETAAGMLGWQRRGWLGETGVSLQRFPDENRIQTAYLWLLAPLLRTAPVRLQAGYGFSSQDAAESRYVPAAGAAIEGRYEPYYTPDNQRSHSVLGAVGVTAGRALTLQASGAFGVLATELAPPASPATPAAERRYHPWNARGSASVALSPGLSLGLASEHLKTAYYRQNQWSASVTYRFTRPSAPANPR